MMHRVGDGATAIVGMRPAIRIVSGHLWKLGSGRAQRGFAATSRPALMAFNSDIVGDPAYGGGARCAGNWNA